MQNKIEKYQQLSSNPVAYFCAEYALDNMAMAGGLGVLAADTVREAHDQGFPMIGIGLFYHKGYCNVELGSNTKCTPEESGLKPALDKNGEKISIVVPCVPKDVVVKAYIWDKGTVPIYFLTTDVEENEPAESRITEHLYVADQNTRFMQEMVLGIGGVKLLDALGIKPSIYHMNDSYSALLAFEVAANLMKTESLNQKDALKAASKKIVYTNHTLVAAGNDAFMQDDVKKYLSRYLASSGFEYKNLIIYGHVSGKKVFSLTMLALSIAGKINCVSKIHADEARAIWPEFQIDAVTNGIHLPTWDKSDGENIVTSHMENKRELIAIINKISNSNWNENDLIICWAKRIVSYKRPLALFEDIKRLERLVNNPGKTIRIIISGIAHSNDAACQEIITKIKGYATKELADNLTYFNNYSPDLARKLIGGVDVWLNTPVVGWEACGTSTMKAALNGTLVCSTKDGWLAEVGLEKIGWALDDKKINFSILDTLENKIVPDFYRAGPGKYDPTWLEKMNTGRALVTENFGTSRMLEDYFEDLYKKLLESK